MAGQRQLILSVKKALSLIDIAVESGGVSVTEAAAALGVDRSSAYRLLETLEAFEYLYKNPDAGKYEAGCRLEEYRLRQPCSAAIYAKVQPTLSSMAAELNEAVHFCAFSPEGMRFIGQEFGPGVIHVSQNASETEPLHCTATGKAALAFMPVKNAESTLRKTKLLRYTENTGTDADKLLTELKTVRRSGFAVDNCELHEGVFCVAAPVFLHASFPSYALGISAPAFRVNDETIKSFSAVVIKNAALLSKILQK